MALVCGLLAMLFLVVPAVEIYVIIRVGSLLGAWPTLAVIGVTAIVGAALAKSQGLAVLRRLQSSLGSAEGVGTAIVEGVLVLAAGVTLLAPGFLTDAIGLALLVPPIRGALARRLAAKWDVMPSVYVSGMPPGFAPPGRNAGEDEDDNEPPPPGVIDV